MWSICQANTQQSIVILSSPKEKVSWYVKYKFLRKMHICHFSIFFLGCTRFLEMLVSLLRTVSGELDPGSCEGRMGCGCGRLVDHRCRSVQSIHLCKATLVDEGTVTNSCLSPTGICIVNSRDKVNSHVFGINWQNCNADTSMIFSRCIANLICLTVRRRGNGSEDPRKFRLFIQNPAVMWINTGTLNKCRYIFIV